MTKLIHAEQSKVVRTLLTAEIQSYNVEAFVLVQFQSTTGGSGWVIMISE